MVSVVKIIDFPVYNTSMRVSNIVSEDALLYGFAVLDNNDQAFLIPLLLATSYWSNVETETYSMQPNTQLRNLVDLSLGVSWWSHDPTIQFSFSAVLSKLMFLAIEDQASSKKHPDYVYIGRDILEGRRRQYLRPPLRLPGMKAFSSLSGALSTAIRRSPVVHFDTFPSHLSTIQLEDLTILRDKQATDDVEAEVQQMQDNFHEDNEQHIL